MMKAHPGLQALVGREASSVEFVRGYVQIRFDGPCLSIFTMPVIRLAAAQPMCPSDDGYAAALVGVVGREVRSASQSAESIEIEFDDGSALLVSLDDSSRVATEAAMLVIDGAPIYSW
jgi:hypothetical protein